MKGNLQNKMQSGNIVARIIILTLVYTHAHCTAIYNPCTKETESTDCGVELNCTDFGVMYGGDPDDISTHHRVCECLKPTDEKACVCNTSTSGLVYRRWVYVEEHKGKPEGVSEDKVPGAGYARAGCYLEEGETCNILKWKGPDSKDSQTYELCKWNYFCKSLPGTVDWGFCRRSVSFKITSSARSIIILLALSTFYI